MSTNWFPVSNVARTQKTKNHSFIHSFILFLQHLFKSTTTQRRSRHSTDTVSKFHAKVKLRVKDLSKVTMWRLERDSNLQPFSRKASNFSVSHHAPFLAFISLLLAQDTFNEAEMSNFQNEILRRTSEESFASAVKEVEEKFLYVQKMFLYVQKMHFLLSIIIIDYLFYYCCSFVCVFTYRYYYYEM